MFHWEHHIQIEPIMMTHSEIFSLDHEFQKMRIMVITSYSLD